MNEPRCHICGHILDDIESACPVCLPNFYHTPGQAYVDRVSAKSVPMWVEKCNLLTRENEALRATVEAVKGTLATHIQQLTNKLSETQHQLDEANLEISELNRVIIRYKQDIAQQLSPK